MTKRFTYSAAEGTRRLADVQAQMQRLERRLKVLRAEEAGLKAFTMPYYDQGQTEVAYLDGTVIDVNWSETDRFIMDQDAVKRFYEKHNRKVPYTKVIVQSYKATKRNG